MNPVRQLHLNLFLDGFGHHVASWRHPNSRLRSPVFSRFLHAAKTAERAKFDAVFFADSLALDPAVVQSGKVRGHEIEPITFLSALAAQTTHIGLIGTATTSYNEPYHIARKFASLDLLSNGRAGWNLVTTDLAAEAQNFNSEQHLGHQQRYARAEEFYDVVVGLWHSWGDKAQLKDPVTGQFFDPQQLHSLNYQGQHFSVAGPLNISPSAQGRPVVVQAGSSERGKALAARGADVIFTAQPDFASAQAFYQDVKARLAQYGRQPQHLSILPGLYVVVGKTEAEAKAKQAQLDELIEESVGLGLLGRMLGNFDLHGLAVHAALPELQLTETGQQSRQRLLTQLSVEQGLSIKQLYQRVAAGRGHFSLVDSAQNIADQIEYWFKQGAADGFNIMPALLTDGLNDFVDLVIPLLQQRQIFRTEYKGTTLRQHYGLAH